MRKTCSSRSASQEPESTARWRRARSRSELAAKATNSHMNGPKRTSTEEAQVKKLRHALPVKRASPRATYAASRPQGTRMGRRMERPARTARWNSKTHHKRLKTHCCLFGITSRYLAPSNARAKGVWRMSPSSTSFTTPPAWGFDRKQHQRCFASLGQACRTFVVNSKIPSAQQCVAKTSHSKPSGLRIKAQLTPPAFRVVGSM
mmetsp:Transcript_28471/g.81521  ORF Transcript_28471/g.81521 Transcript_28471/m.81521 type:complete len:204 (-) Transcript_28471:191-802(-)